MRLAQRFLRLFCPGAERERREFRKEVNRTAAHAEDLTRTVVGMRVPPTALFEDVVPEEKKKAVSKSLPFRSKP